eukprot:1160176-Pelagomonas_calceolata.AAC.3
MGDLDTAENMMRRNPFTLGKAQAIWLLRELVLDANIQLGLYDTCSWRGPGNAGKQNLWKASVDPVCMNPVREGWLGWVGQPAVSAWQDMYPLAPAVYLLPHKSVFSWYGHEYAVGWGIKWREAWCPFV